MSKRRFMSIETFLVMLAGAAAGGGGSGHKSAQPATLHNAQQYQLSWLNILVVYICVDRSLAHVCRRWSWWWWQRSQKRSDQLCVEQPLHDSFTARANVQSVTNPERMQLQALQLVVVALHAKALSLLYVDQLLEDVKQVIFRASMEARKKEGIHGRKGEKDERLLACCTWTSCWRTRGG